MSRYEPPASEQSLDRIADVLERIADVLEGRTGAALAAVLTEHRGPFTLDPDDALARLKAMTRGNEVEA